GHERAAFVLAMQEPFEDGFRAARGARLRKRQKGDRFRLAVTVSEPDVIADHARTPRTVADAVAIDVDPLAVEHEVTAVTAGLIEVPVEELGTAALLREIRRRRGLELQRELRHGVRELDAILPAVAQ